MFIVILFFVFSCRYIGNTGTLALLLDYDGTLAPLALRPDLATLPLETKRVLERLANMSGVYISIISGRNVSNVKEMVSCSKLGQMYTGPCPRPIIIFLFEPVAPNPVVFCW